MDLVHEMTYHAMLRPPMTIGDGGFGMRTFFEVISGTVEGPRIHGKFTGAGGDWLIVGPDGFGRIDVRAQIETHDGAIIFLHYPGLLEMNDAIQAALANATGTEYADHYFRTTPRFETGDERYTWLNRSVFVGEGRVLKGFGVEYRVFRVV